jgi:hypothetical protein
MPMCTQCDRPATAGDRFCAQCGVEVTEVGQVLTPQPRRVTRNGWWLLAGAVLVLIGTLLPWARQSVDGYATVSTNPGGGSVIVFLVLAIAVVAAGWPLLTGGLPKRRLIGTSVAAGFLALFAVTNWSNLNTVQKQAAGLGGGLETVRVSAGSGLALYTVGVVVLCVLIVRLWVPLRRAAQTAASSL